MDIRQIIKRHFV